MIKLENWTEIAKGSYRYVVSANACYEIHIMFHDLKLIYYQQIAIYIL